VPSATDDHVAITRLQSAYADLIDRKAFAELPGLLRADAVVTLDLVTRPPITITGPHELAEFLGPAMASFAFFQFVILNSHIELEHAGDPDRASARLFFAELRRTTDGEASQTIGLYRDEYRRDAAGRWWIAGRRYQTLARQPSGEVFALPADL
jgi:hypothetical protein